MRKKQSGGLFFSPWVSPIFRTTGQGPEPIRALGFFRIQTILPARGEKHHHWMVHFLVFRLASGNFSLPFLSIYGSIFLGEAPPAAGGDCNNQQEGLLRTLF